MSSTMHPQLTPLSNGGTVQNLDIQNLDVLGVTFDSKILLRCNFDRFQEQLLKDLVC